MSDNPYKPSGDESEKIIASPTVEDDPTNPTTLLLNQAKKELVR